MEKPPHRILYCRCAYAQVVPDDVKDAVLEGLCTSGKAFDSVSDLCEMSARRDPRLKSLLEGGEPVKIAACYRRAVKWLFHQAEAPFPDDESVEVLNMREQSADEVLDKLLDRGEDSEGGEAEEKQQE